MRRASYFMKRTLLIVLFGLLGGSVWAQDAKAPSKPRMQYMGAYDAGQPGVSIYKMYDPTEEVVCYLLMPEVVSRKPAENGTWTYDGNTVGSISCLKVRLPVVPVAGSKPVSVKNK